MKSDCRDRESSASLCLTKAWLSVLGGFSVHLVLGTLYIWANITSAVTGYLRRFDPSLTYNDTILVYASALGTQGMTMFLGGLIEKRIGAPLTVLVGGFSVVLGTFLSSFCTTLSGFVFTYGIMFGIGLGITYSAPIACSVKWMPNRKGLVTGIIVAGFGGGSFVFGLIATRLVNPTQISVEDSGSKDGYFAPDSPVVINVPKMMRTLSLLYLCMVIFAYCLMSEPTEEEKALALATAASESSVTSHNLGGVVTINPLGEDQAMTQSSDHQHEGMVGFFNGHAGGGEISSNSEHHSTSPFPTVRTITKRGIDSSSLSTYQSLPVEADAIEMSNLSMTGGLELPASNMSLSSPIISSTAIATANIISTSSPTSISSTSSSSSASIAANAIVIPKTLPDVSPYELVTTPLAWHLASCFIMTTVGGMYLAGTFKTYAQESFTSELFLSTIGSVASIFNAGGRIFWGALADRIGLIETLLIMSFAFALIIATYSFSPQLGEPGFAIWTCFIFFFEGANFALYLPLTLQVFGSKNAGSNYGLIFSTYSVFVVLNILILAKHNASFHTASSLMGIITFLGFVDLLFLVQHVSRYAAKETSCKFR